jgi:lipopolysaccharide transport system ATP-binding protein
MMGDIAIHVEHLSKMYRLGVINNGTLWRDIQTWIALKRGKEDPHSEIGEDKYSGDEDHFWALRDISFNIKQGDRVGIIGKNGAGKSTLLKILSRITAPTEGCIKIKGKIASLLEVGTGFHAELTGKENIYLNGAILGMKKRRITKKLDEIIAFSGIEHHIDTPVKRYSSGMFVRLAFAVAAHLDSDILIADEILAVGDAEFQKKALGKMQDLSTGQGRTVLFVSHNMTAVKSLCNCGILLENGKIKITSEDIERLVGVYANASPTNFLSTKWNNQGNDFYDSGFTPISLELLEEDGQPVTTDISAERSYKIKLEFDVKEVNSNMEYDFLCFDQSGSILFYTSPYWANINYCTKSGRNTVFFLLPKNIFNTRSYTISLGYAPIVGFQTINPSLLQIALRINVLKKNSPFTDTLSLIAPELTWEVSNK